MKTTEKIAILKKEFDENNNSHVFLVETDDLNTCLSEIKNLIKSIIAKDDQTSNQIDDETYIELIVVKPDGKEIKKDAIIELQNRLKTKPILSPYIFYIIYAAESLNLIAANKLLKTIEEPNDNTIGFLITANVDLIIPTIKSRCELISIMYNNQNTQEIDNELHEIVKKMIVAIEKKDHIEYSKIKSNESINKENFKTIENILKNYYNTACNLTTRENIDSNTVEIIRRNNSYDTLIKKAEYLNKIFNKLTQNMNNDLLLEKIFLDLKEVK